MVESISGDSVKLVEIDLFMKCFANVEDSSKPMTLWVACVTTYLEHPCKIWFEHPVQVWTTVASPETSLIPVTNIKSRIIY